MINIAPDMMKLFRINEQPPADAPTVLVVDDCEQSFPFRLNHKLMKRGYNAESFLDGRKGVEAIKRNKTYIGILINIGMPALNGFEATKRIRNLGYRRPIIGYSQLYTYETSADVARRVGMTYLHYPCSSEAHFNPQDKHEDERNEYSSLIPILEKFLYPDKDIKTPRLRLL